MAERRHDLTLLAAMRFADFRGPDRRRLAVHGADALARNVFGFTSGRYDGNTTRNHLKSAYKTF
jgi:hypothetical protein